MTPGGLQRSLAVAQFGVRLLQQCRIDGVGFGGMLNFSFMAFSMAACNSASRRSTSLDAFLTTATVAGSAEFSWPAAMETVAFL